MWKPAVVSAATGEPRSYTVISQDGQQYRRNRRHLLNTREPPPVISGPPRDELPDISVQSSNMSSDSCDAGNVNVQMNNAPVIQNTNVPNCVQSNNVHKTSYGRALKVPNKYKDFVM